MHNANSIVFEYLKCIDISVINYFLIEITVRLLQCGGLLYIFVNLKYRNLYWVRPNPTQCEGLFTWINWLQPKSHRRACALEARPTFLAVGQTALTVYALCYVCYKIQTVRELRNLYATRIIDHWSFPWLKWTTFFIHRWNVRLVFKISRQNTLFVSYASCWGRANRTRRIGLGTHAEIDNTKATLRP